MYFRQRYNEMRIISPEMNTRFKFTISSYSN